MGDIEKKTTDQVKNFGEQLKGMSFSMRVFSLTMRSLYAENAVGRNDDLAVKFRKLRDDTRNDAMVYLKGILPVSTKFVSSIAEYFDYYISLNYKDWRKMLKDILEETTGYQQLCSTLLKMHEEILVPLKRRQDEAKILITEFKDLKEEYEKQRKSLEVVQANAAYLRFIPGVGEIASNLPKVQMEKTPPTRLEDWIPAFGQIVSPLFGAIVNSHLAEEVPSTKPAATFGSASITISKSLIPALEHFIEGLRTSAGFFSIMKQELLNFQCGAEKGQENPKELYYKVMKSQAKDMKSICQTFHAVLPDVRTDFLAIPDEGADQDYVDEWLAQAKTMIQENVSTLTLSQKLVKSITD